MTLTDKKIQDIQGIVKENASLSEGKVFRIPNTTQYYKVVHSIDETTQALAVVPVDNKSGANPDYSQTAIVVAGTQPGANESTKNVVEASGYFGMVDGQMTAQYETIDKFYKDTVKKLEKHNGTVSNMSGFSQSGPPVAKIAADNKVPKVTNFMDWGAIEATKTKKHRITPENIAYLNKHATVYLETTRDVTKFDGNDGNVPYGKQVTVEGTGSLTGDHSTKFPQIKGNQIDIEYYVKRGQFVSGMTKAQVIEVAKKKAKAAKKTTANPSTWVDSTDYKTYVKEYEKTYGEFATVKTKVEETKVDKVQVSRDKSAKLQGQLKTASASKRILLRKDLVSTVAQTAKLAGEGFVTAIGARLDEERSEISSGFKTAKENARNISQYLSESELQDIFSAYTLGTVWDSEQEETNRTGVTQLQTALAGFGDRLTEASAKLTEVDQTGALYFNQT